MALLRPSTNFDQSYLRASKMDQITALDGVVEFDPLSPDLHYFINSLEYADVHEYKGEPFPTIAFKYHGTTTTTWIILMYNAINTVFEVPNGMSIYIPTKSSIDAGARIYNVPVVRRVTI